MKRQRLLVEKAAARKMDYHPTRQFTHSVIDSHLEALDLIDGGTKAVNRTAEVRKGLDDVFAAIMAGETGRALYMLGIINHEMLSSDYRRYPTWEDQQPRIDEEFGARVVPNVENPVNRKVRGE
jgi:hypothetical protein